MDTPTGIQDEESLEELQHILEVLEESYQRICPRGQEQEARFLEDDENLVVDHIGIRTFAHPRTSMDALARVFTSRGYRETGSYIFPGKSVRGLSLSPPQKKLPRIFLSELHLDALPVETTAIIEQSIASLDSEITGETLLGAERNWPPISFSDYLAVEQHSQYGAWVLAHGIRVNHKAWSVNHMETLEGLEEIHDVLEAHGFQWEVRGRSQREHRPPLLAQSSTRADTIPVVFSGMDIQSISGGYVEFTHRFRNPEGTGVFDGFVDAQANPIFDSTRRTQ